MIQLEDKIKSGNISEAMEISLNNRVTALEENKAKLQVERNIILEQLKGNTYSIYMKSVYTFLFLNNKIIYFIYHPVIIINLLSINCLFIILL